MRLRMMVAASTAAALWVLPAAAQDWRGGRARVDGIVKNEKAEPIEGCKVSLRWGKSTHGGPDLTTDKKGRWAIFGLVGGPWDVDFEAPGYATKKISLDLQEGGRNPAVDVQLEPLKQVAAAAAAPAQQEILVGGKKVSKETAEAIERGNQAFTERKYAEAREDYLKALAELSDNEPLIMRVAAAYDGEGKTADALKYARMAVEKNPENTYGWMLIAEKELQRGNLEAGTAALERIPPEKITDAQPYLNIGILSINKKRPAEAELALSKAIVIQPDLAEAYQYRGLARMQQKKNAEAKVDLKKALELAPESPSAQDIKDWLKSMP